ncbi:MAG: flippase-like domain-containing protein [Acidobacteria bacterium]|nr:flippase-like domain-containing protein [Acidobacteriota bacterium]
MIAIILVVMAIAGWYLVRGWREGFQWAKFAGLFRSLDPAWIGAATLIALSTYVGRALRWRVLIRHQKRDPGLWGLVSATAIGFTAIVLFGRPGEMVRPYLISAKERLTFSSQMAAWLLERMYDLMMALLVFGFALAHVRGSGVQAGERLQWVLELGGWFVGGVGTICLIVFIALRQFGERSKKRILDGLGFLPEPVRDKASGLLSSFTDGVQSTRNWGAVFEVLVYSIIEWILIVACYFCIFRSAPQVSHFGIMDVLIFVGFVSFGAVIQIPGVGGGMQIVSIFVLTELFGLPVEISSGLAMVLWGITFVVIVPAGLALAFREGLNWGKLRHIEENV